MKKNPILVLTGLAVAAVAGVAGLTREQWMPKETPLGLVIGARLTKAKVFLLLGKTSWVPSLEIGRAHV